MYTKITPISPPTVYFRFLYGLFLIPLFTCIYACKSDVPSAENLEDLANCHFRLDSSLLELSQNASAFRGDTLMVNDYFRLSQFSDLSKDENARYDAIAYLVKSGVIYEEQNDYNYAVNILRKGEDIVEAKIFERSLDTITALIYNLQALNHEKVLEYNQALYYSAKVLDLYEKWKLSSGMIIQKMNDCITYNKIGQFSEAIKAALEAEETFSGLKEKLPTDERIFYIQSLIDNNISISLRELALIKRSEGNILESQDLLERAYLRSKRLSKNYDFILEPENLAKAKLNYCSVVLQQNIVDEYDDLLALLNSIVPKVEYKEVTVRKYMSLSLLKKKQGDFEQSFSYSDSAYAAVGKGVEPQTKYIREVNDLMRPYLVKLTYERADIYEARFADTEIQQDLLTAEKLFAEAELMIDEITRYETNSYLVNSLRNTLFPAYDEAILTVKKLYELTGDDIWLEKLLQIKMKSSNFNLRQQIQGKIYAQEYQNSFSVYREKDRDSIFDIMKAEQAYASAEQENERARWQNELLRLEQERKSFLSALQKGDKTAQQYYAARYPSEPPSIDEVRKGLLKDKKTIILDYSVIGDNCFVNMIAQDGIKIKDLKLSKDFFERLARLQEALKESADGSFVTDAYEMYRQLFLPIAEDVKQFEHLIIGPFSSLQGLPFEILLREPASESSVSNADFTDLKYLLYDFDFSYVYSLEAQILFSRLYAKSVSSSKQNIGVFIADYSQEREVEERETRCENSPLPGLSEKARTRFSELRDAKIFEDAEKNDLIENATSFDMLHLVMHGCSAADNPLNYSLVFSEDELTLAELYNTEISVRSVVLASCNGSRGVYNPNEGLVSISRAFNTAGCSHLITSLNAVNDASTAYILDRYYEYLLKESFQPSAALTQAKRDYLSEPKHLHNINFWANMVSVGIMRE